LSPIIGMLTSSPLTSFCNSPLRPPIHCPLPTAKMSLFSHCTAQGQSLSRCLPRGSAPSSLVAWPLLYSLNLRVETPHALFPSCRSKEFYSILSLKLRCFLASMCASRTPPSCALFSPEPRHSLCAIMLNGPPSKCH